MRLEITLKDFSLGHPGAPPLGPPFSGTLSCEGPIALIGPNGSGKSTFLKQIITATPHSQDALSLSIGGQKLQLALVFDFAKNVAVVEQQTPYPPYLKVCDFLSTAFYVGSGLLGKLPPNQDELMTKALEKVGLRGVGEQRLSLLSSGQRQRVFIAHAMLKKPQLMLLDEPTSHLDPGGVCGFWKLIEEEFSNLILMLSTHDLAGVKKWAKSCIVFKKGQIIFMGSKETFLEQICLETLFEQSVG